MSLFLNYASVLQKWVRCVLFMLCIASAPCMLISVLYVNVIYTFEMLNIC